MREIAKKRSVTELRCKRGRASGARKEIDDTCKSGRTDKILGFAERVVGYLVGRVKRVMLKRGAGSDVPVK